MTTFHTDEGTRYCAHCDAVATDITYPGSRWTCEGHTLVAILASSGVGADVTNHGVETDDQGWTHTRWTVALSRHGVRTTVAVPFRTGMAIEAEPTAADVVHSVINDYDWFMEDGTLPEPALTIEDAREAVRQVEEVEARVDALASMFDTNEWADIQLASHYYEGL